MRESPDRYARQAALVPRQTLDSLEVTVIGVGAIGRQVALQLAALGVPRLRLIDFDHVELANVTTQGYIESEVGLAKVAATARAVQQINTAIDLDLVEDRYRPSVAVGDALFCCVDSIAARAAIWRSAAHRCRYWCDGRMLGEVMRVLTVAECEGREHYPTTLFEPTEVVPGPCTAQGTIYTAAITAGLMVHQFCRWLRGQPVDTDLACNLLASELVAR
jgi:molybdopterin/thiamine biosynthesis adenylyltransferase